MNKLQFLILIILVSSIIIIFKFLNQTYKDSDLNEDGDLRSTSTSTSLSEYDNHFEEENFV